MTTMTKKPKIPYVVSSNYMESFEMDNGAEISSYDLDLDLTIDSLRAVTTALKATEAHRECVAKFIASADKAVIMYEKEQRDAHFCTLLEAKTTVFDKLYKLKKNIIFDALTDLLSSAEKDTDDDVKYFVNSKNTKNGITKDQLLTDFAKYLKPVVAKLVKVTQVLREISGVVKGTDKNCRIVLQYDESENTQHSRWDNRSDCRLEVGSLTDNNDNMYYTYRYYPYRQHRIQEIELMNVSCVIDKKTGKRFTF